MKIKLADIKVSNRIREELGDLEGLKRSITKVGQINALVLDKDLNLITGERRYQALKALNFTEVDAVIKDQVTELDKLTMEIEENLNRKEFTDAEKVRGLLRLHRAKQKDAGVPTPGRAGGWTLQDTAELLSYSKGAISVMLRVAEAQEIQESLPPEQRNEAFMKALETEGTFSAYKELVNAEADAVLARVEELQKEEAEGESREAVSFVDGCIENANCLDYVKKIPDESVHLVLTDPPYGIDYQDQADYKGDDSPEYAIGVMAKLAPELWRVCAKNSFCIVFFGIKNMPDLVAAMIAVGFKASPTPFVWVKDVTQGSNNQPNRWLTSAFEFAWIFCKGDPILNIPGSLGYFIDKPPSQEIKRHPTQKPVGLIKYLLAVHGHPGQYLFDPFAGSGIILQSGLDMNLHVCGCELNTEYYRKARAAMIEQKSGVSVLDATLLQLGFSREAIALATDETKNTIAKNNYTNMQVTILVDGSLFILDQFGS